MENGVMGLWEEDVMDRTKWTNYIFFKHFGDPR